MSLIRRTSVLALAGLVEQLSQMLLPVILVRHLTVTEFGEYRMLWLLAATGLAVLPFFVPGSLFYFLPRLDPVARARLLTNTASFMLAAGFLGAVIVLLLQHSGSNEVASLSGGSIAVPLFIGTWVAASLFDNLAVADGRANLQAGAAIVVCLVRTIGLGTVAIVVPSVYALAVCLVVFAFVKLLLALIYIRVTVVGHQAAVDASLFREQLAYAAPFAIGNGLFLLRAQSDQWVASSVFGPELFAYVSVAAVVLGFSGIVRQPMRSAMLPSLGRLIASGESRRVASLLACSHGLTWILILPGLGLLFVCATPVVKLIYTESYSRAGVLMQIYLFGVAVSLVGGGYLLAAFNQRKLAVMINGLALVPSIVLSYLGAMLIGLEGAVIGSMFALIVSEYMSSHFIARRLGCSTWSLSAGTVGLRVFICTGLASVVAWSIGAAVGVNAMVQILYVCATYIAVFFCFWYALRLNGEATRLRMSLKQFDQAK